MSQTDGQVSGCGCGPVIKEEAGQVFGSKATFGCSSGFVGKLGKSNSINGSWGFNAFGCSTGSATDERKEQLMFNCQQEMKSFKELASESNRLLTGINFDNYDDIPVQLSNNNYKPINTFGEAGFTTAVLANINKKKWTKPTPVQRYAIPIILGGEDLMACSQTGSGKTGAFVLPILTRLIQDGALTHPCERAHPNCIILSPTRTSAMKIYVESCRLAKGTCLKICGLYGGRHRNRCIKKQTENLRQGCNILVGTPILLERFIQNDLVGLKMVKFLVLDEANRLLNATFDPHVRHIIEHHSMPPVNTRKTLMFASALPPDMQILAQKYLCHGYTIVCVGIVDVANQDATEKSVQTTIFHKKDVDLLKQDVGNNIPIIILNSDGEESGKNDLENKIGDALENDATSSRQVPPLLHDVQNRKRTFEQSSSSSAIGGNGSCNELDILQSTSNFSRQIPVKMTNEPSCSKRFALSAIPLRNNVFNECRISHFSKKETADNVGQIPLLVIPSDKFDSVDFANLRPVIIDGSNVAMRAGNNRRFNCRGILLAVKTFVERGHRVLSFVPQSRMDQDPYRWDKPIADQHLLDVMEAMGVLCLTPGRHVIDWDGRIRRYQCYDDNMIVQYAHKSGGVILSVDNYLDVARKHSDWAPTIADRLLMFTWVGDEIILPEDPHGKYGPSLDEILHFRPGEKVENRKKPMDEMICREMLHKIHVALQVPAAQTGRNFKLF